MIWAVIGGMAIGVAVGEYYRRIIDRIRREQITDLRSRSVQQKPRLVVKGEAYKLQRPQKRQMISEEQYAVMKKTGRAAGRYNGSELH